MFPNVLQDYPEALLQESQTVLNLLSKEQIDNLFPHIQLQYLQNLKESEKKELVVRLEGFLKPVEITKAGGKVSMAGKSKKVKKLRNEGRPDPDGGPMPEDWGQVSWDWKEQPDVDMLSLVLNPLGVYVYDDPIMVGSDQIGFIFSKKPLSSENLAKIEADFEADLEDVDKEELLGVKGDVRGGAEHVPNTSEYSGPGDNATLSPEDTFGD
jgi:hypothetical protein